MTERPTLNRGALALSLRVAAQSRAVISSDHITRAGDGQCLVDTGILRPFSNQVECIEIDGEDREIVWDNGSKRHRYFSPASGWVDVPADHFKSYRVDFNALLALVRRWLGMSAHTCPASLVPELFWDLGETWIGRRRIAVLFLRRSGLAETLSRARSALLRYPRRGSSLILTDRRPSEHGPDLPGDPILVSLLDLFPPDMDVLGGIDADSLTAFIGAAPKPRREWRPVECSEDGGYLRIYDRRFRFSGVTHKRIIRLLYEAWKRGEHQQRTVSVFEEAESRSRTMSQAFSGCKEEWKEAIGYGGGSCWLKVGDHQ